MRGSTLAVNFAPQLLIYNLVLTLESMTLPNVQQRRTSGENIVGPAVQTQTTLLNTWQHPTDTSLRSTVTVLHTTLQCGNFYLEVQYF